MLLHPPALPDLPEHSSSAAGLLKEALRQNPDDELALHQLIHLQAKDLAYSLHELPAGVLYEVNGATVEQCDLLLGELDEFIQNVQQANQYEKYHGLVERCHIHSGAYKNFLIVDNAQKTYWDFFKETTENLHCDIQ